MGAGEKAHWLRVHTTLEGDHSHGHGVELKVMTSSHQPSTAFSFPRQGRVLWPLLFLLIFLLLFYVFFSSSF